ncbi:MAG: hypothetical protein EBE86_034880 [Hormoscilla sp. GUM202]|nr:hypothetical protein [Hormoscilla sp. GUM202]
MSYTDFTRTTQHFERSPACGCASKSIASSPQPAIAPESVILHGVKISAVPMLDSIDNQYLAKENAVTAEAIGLSHGRSGGN